MEQQQDKCLLTQREQTIGRLQRLSNVLAHNIKTTMDLTSSRVTAPGENRLELIMVQLLANEVSQMRALQEVMALLLEVQRFLEDV